MKANYSSNQWALGLAAFLASGAPHPARAASAISHAKTCFTNTPITVESYQAEDADLDLDWWQESLIGEDSMNSSTTMTSITTQIAEAHVVSDEVASFVFHGHENDFDFDEIYLLPIEEEIVTATIVSDEVAPFHWNGDDE